MKKYKAIFFDWDGTAVTSRKAPVDEVVKPMKELLARGVRLAVISGTTIENIGQGKLHEHFSLEERRFLYYGLGRGAYNYTFDEQGEPVLLSHAIPDKERLLAVHRACFDVHAYLLEHHDFPTDIVFSRPNYCKIDLMVENDRGDNLFFQENELDILKESLKKHGFDGGPAGLIRLAAELGEKRGIKLSATTDAKYLEAGMTSKSDNVNALLAHFYELAQITASDCSFWGDEYIGLDDGLFGSDSYMITEATKAGDFFDVSEAAGKRPDNVKLLGGGVPVFLDFLQKQSKL